MATFECPNCHTRSQAMLVWAGSEAVRSRLRGDYTTYDAAFRCINCGRVVGGTTQVPQVEDSKAEILGHWPVSIGGKDFPDVPDGIAAAADEAHHCLSIGAVRGAIGLARAILEATTKNHEITSGNLEKE